MKGKVCCTILIDSSVIVSVHLFVNQLPIVIGVRRECQLFVLDLEWSRPSQKIALKKNLFFPLVVASRSHSYKQLRFTCHYMKLVA